MYIFLLLFSGLIVSASDLNYDTDLALKSNLADKTTITSMHKRNDRINAVGVNSIILTSNDVDLTWTQTEKVPFLNIL